MRSFRKLLLSVLAMLPVTSISTPAYSKLNEMAGEEQSELFQTQVRTAKRLIFSEGAISTTVQQAKERISAQTGVTDEDALSQELEKQVQILQANGLIELNEMNIGSKSPSAW